MIVWFEWARLYRIAFPQEVATGITMSEGCLMVSVTWRLSSLPMLIRTQEEETLSVKFPN
ncbi:hypothetical protein [Nostoc sp.]|uniref:hypothetical protein n=1 Tax=Nostoc sp. TaxID=1180 RepID=UPI002FFB0D9B